MANLHQQIAEKFLAKLADSKTTDIDTIDKLRNLLVAGKKIRAEDFVKIFSATSDTDIK
jgi:hypothetical protein